MKDQATETLNIIHAGYYVSSRGRTIDFAKEQAYSVSNTVLYSPQTLKNLRSAMLSSDQAKVSVQVQVQVQEGTTQKIAHQLSVAQTAPHQSLVLLNFASARHPGGGFLRGARAQEEDLCRCSGLYPTLLTQPLYYKVNREQSSMVYSDYTIYSPHVPFFRLDGREECLDKPIFPSVITMPAPNTGPFLKKREGVLKDLEEPFFRRWCHVIAVAHHHQHSSLLVGAWGCGAFQGDPYLVASMAKKAIKHGTGCINNIVFAIPNTGKQSRRNLSIFKEMMASE